jgi:hypothetical protein
LLHVFDLPFSLEIRESNGDSAYAYYTALWVIADDVEEAQRELQRLADSMSNFTKDNGLALNGAKTQVMIGGARAKDVSNIVIALDGAEVRPGNTFELLGVTFHQRFTVRPYLANLSIEARSRASRVAQLDQHLPCGHLMRQLGSGLLMGKLAHCLPIVAQPRMPGSAKPIPEGLESIQIAIHNMARSVVGYSREDRITVKELLDLA